MQTAHELAIDLLIINVAIRRGVVEVCQLCAGRPCLPA